jgi:hypothetical protein
VLELTGNRFEDADKYLQHSYGSSAFLNVSCLSKYVSNFEQRFYFSYFSPDYPKIGLKKVSLYSITYIPQPWARFGYG